MEKKHSTHPKHKYLTKHQVYILQFSAGIIIGALVIFTYTLYRFHTKYSGRVYPGVTVGNVPFWGQTPDETQNYWLMQNDRFMKLNFEFVYEGHVATLSGQELDLGYDATLSAIQAYAIGRSGNTLADLYQKISGLFYSINLEPYFRWHEEVLNTTLDTLAQQIVIEPENALFEFNNGRVSAFKLSKNGRELDIDGSKRIFSSAVNGFINKNTGEKMVVFNLQVKPKVPVIKTDDINNFGITEVIGSGESYFQGSIPGRIHNVALGAARINGVLIKPGEVFSFNNAVGDISAATGYKQAYVIKNGRTVLDDGGGICQVSTTLFRAGLNSGLPIIERHAHSYRVGYYEQKGWKPGFDATVYAPSYDLKIKNDTGNYILIQAITDTANAHLTFELYGKKDGRIVEISQVRLWDARPAPPTLYQDDPTLPTGTVKQVDWSNPGIKAAFDYKVMRGSSELFRTTFFSNFVPWQAVYLKGTGTN